MTPPLQGAAVRHDVPDRRDIAVGQTLDQLRSGQRASILGIQGQPSLRRRLLEMGLSTGVQIQAVRRAPLGDPIQFLVRGYHLCLRRDDAQHVLVRAEPE